LSPKQPQGNRFALQRGEREELIRTLKARVEKHLNRNKGLEWAKVQSRLEADAEKFWSLNEMETTGGDCPVALVPLDQSLIIAWDDHSPTLVLAGGWL
jgi:hypothetical protein